MDNQAPLSPADVRRRPTATLEQLLRDFDAPRVIDYLCASAPPPSLPAKSPFVAHWSLCPMVSFISGFKLSTADERDRVFRY